MNLARLKIVFEVRSTSPVGHWRDGCFWHNAWVEVEESQITETLREDPRIEIREIEVEEYPEEVE